MAALQTCNGRSTCEPAREHLCREGRQREQVHEFGQQYDIGESEAGVGKPVKRNTQLGEPVVGSPVRATNTAR